MMAVEEALKVCTKAVEEVVALTVVVALVWVMKW